MDKLTAERMLECGSKIMQLLVDYGFTHAESVTVLEELKFDIFIRNVSGMIVHEHI